jgi:hypothetical protein
MPNNLHGVFQRYLVPHTNIDYFLTPRQWDNFSYLPTPFIEHLLATNPTVEKALGNAYGGTIKR